MRLVQLVRVVRPVRQVPSVGPGLLVQWVCVDLQVRTVRRDSAACKAFRVCAGFRGCKEFKGCPVNRAPKV